MNEPHLIAAVRYIELNPVRAKLVSRAKEWKWSSIHTHITGAEDKLVRVTPMLSQISDWENHLDSHIREDMELIRSHTRTGRPLGDSTFIRAAESMTGRILTPQAPGRKSRAGKIRGLRK
jgi:putative transposase